MNKLKKGDKVKHNHFGKGTVLEDKGIGMTVVKFDKPPDGGSGLLAIFTEELLKEKE